ncbi:hypothetical protein AMK11_11080 [Streptomyces sp. CB02414]|nr:hypothetical protein AMK11_11080 [Streptomyces sp. CB02414]
MGVGVGGHGPALRGAAAPTRAALGVPPRPFRHWGRHDCPQLGGTCPQPRTPARRPPEAPRGRSAAYGGKGTCRGVSARSGWRVRAVHFSVRPIPRRSEDGHPPARPRPTDNPRATRTPTGPAAAPQAPRSTAGGLRLRLRRSLGLLLVRPYLRQ